MDALTAQAPPTTVQTASASDSGVAADSPRPKTERIAYIDMARGLFLILMASTHAMTLAGIPATSPLADWGLPRGWATTGLIMLCGFMVATFAREMQERARIRHRVLRRAKQVLLVMFASNVLMVVVKRVVTFETDPLFSLDWWVGLLFFRSESSISGVLLPIALFLLVSPLLVALYDGCRSKVYGVTLTAGLLFFVALTWSVQALAADGHGTHDALSAMFGAGAGGFPVIPMVASGALFIATSQLLSTVPMILAPFVARTLMDVSHLLLILMLAIVITRWEPSQRGLRFIPVLGRFSLLTFLAHRVVEQTLALGLRPFHLPGELVYAVCLGGGVFGSLALILLRRRFAGYDRVLRAVYL